MVTGTYNSIQIDFGYALLSLLRQKGVFVWLGLVSYWYLFGNGLDY